MSHDVATSKTLHSDEKERSPPEVDQVSTRGLTWNAIFFVIVCRTRECKQICIKKLFGCRVDDVFFCLSKKGQGKEYLSLM